ncbi:hypothetical protein J6590_035861 [Homalodisca vitripennis]|nr:hypothetical protein J6590_035861 [Homalodisca vitripennis]
MALALVTEEELTILVTTTTDQLRREVRHVYLTPPLNFVINTPICDARLADSSLFCTVQSLSFFWAYSFHR